MEMDTYWFLDTLVRVHADADSTGGRLGLAECIAPAGHQPPPHVHHREDEGFYVLEGEITVYTPDEEVVLGPGAFLNAPRGVPHTFRVSSPERARWLVTSSPAGFEAFVRDYGQPAARDELPLLDGPPDVERLVAIAAGHGIEILGPPGMLPAELPARAA
jgi:mannose-6-phosphate isomerase-like protein (cupin superfamily)